MPILVDVKNISKSYNNQWAIKDISFSLESGCILGIIGDRGAGKSTILNILARVIYPTVGRAIIKGKVASLLDNNTGIQQQLTGKENVYLQAAFQGIKRKQISHQIDKIFAFGNLEKLKDTPVGLYSQNQRLFFQLSLAKNLTPNVLLVDNFLDEIIAIGDDYLQKKFIDYLQKLTLSGGTVLLVSSKRPQLFQDICQLCMCLSKGEIIDYGLAKDVINKYENTLGILNKNKKEKNREETNILFNQYGRIIDINIISTNQEDESKITMSDDIWIKLSIEIFVKCKITCYFDIYKNKLHLLRTAINPDLIKENKPGIYETKVCLPSHLLAEHKYSVNVLVELNHLENDVKKHLSFDNAANFYVHDTGEGVIARGLYDKTIPWILSPLLKWELEKKEND